MFLDYSKCSHGKYGFDKDKVDKNAVNFEYHGKKNKHESQKGDFDFYLIFQLPAAGEIAVTQNRSRNENSPSGL